MNDYEQRAHDLALEYLRQCARPSGPEASAADYVQAYNRIYEELGKKFAEKPVKPSGFHS